MIRVRTSPTKCTETVQSGDPEVIVSEPKRAYGVDEVRQSLSISRTAVFNLLRRGEITSVKIGRRRIIPAASLDAYTARLAAQAEGR